MSSQFGEDIAKTMIMPKMIASGQPIPPQWQSLAPTASPAQLGPQRNLGPAPAGGPASTTMGTNAGQRNTIMSAAAIEQPFAQTKLGRANTGAT